MQLTANMILCTVAHALVSKWIYQLQESSYHSIDSSDTLHFFVKFIILFVTVATWENLYALSMKVEIGWTESSWKAIYLSETDITSLDFDCMQTLFSNNVYLLG